FNRYSAITFRNDVALLRLKTPIKFEEHVEKIELNEELVPINATLTIVGWGFVGWNKENPKRTQVIKVQHIGLNRCRKIANGSAIYPEHLCTFSRAGHGPCKASKEFMEKSIYAYLTPLSSHFRAILVVLWYGKGNRLAYRYHSYRYFRGAFRDDVGLLRLRSPLKLGERVKKIELLSQIVPYNATLTLVGRGYISKDNKTTKITQMIKAKNIALKLCRKMQPDFIYPGHLCTFVKKGKGTCSGDSGGPVVWYGRQVGIVSWSKGCGAGYFDVHSRISYFLPWIKATIAANSD
uniref:chymotrypsin-2-like n=1 Tax=Anopheles coluzzii TaxID=1518534 RepID=UPI0020FFD094